MSEVIYTHSLPLKEFEISLNNVKSWIDENVSGCCGFSKDYSFKLHFTVMPAEELLITINAYWDSLVDDGAYALEQAKARSLLIEETKIGYGIKVRAYLGYLCELNSFTPTQYAEMLADSNLSFCSQLLISGALESCKGIIDYFTPTSYFTNDMKVAMSAELQKYITLVGNL
jgi:hypothetical protein